MVQPLISVIIPCYNQAHFLDEAIESVINQSYQNTEIIVVDDGSSDNTKYVVKKYQNVSYIYQNNQGLSSARNKGLENCNGKYVVFLDSDDRLLIDALINGVKYINDNPECVLVYGNVNLISEIGTYIKTNDFELLERDFFSGFLRYCQIPTISCAMLEVKSLNEIDGFDNDLSPVADWDLYLRIIRKFPIFCHGNVVSEYRQHRNNMSKDAYYMLSTALKVFRKNRKYCFSDLNYQENYMKGLTNFLDWWNDILKRDIENSIEQKKYLMIIKWYVLLVSYYFEKKIMAYYIWFGKLKK